MAKIAAFKVSDFSGGVRRDKSSLEMQKNELLDARNIEINERGRIRIRRGGQQHGQTLTGTIENSATWSRGIGPSTNFLVNNNAATCVISDSTTNARVTTAVITTDTTIVVNSTAGLAASGTVEIEGDLIAYTGVSGGTTLTGVTGITSAHAVGAAVNQWDTLAQSGTAVDGSMGITYAALNNILFFGGTGANIKQLSSAGVVSDVSGEPSIILLTTYRDRLYGVGDGTSGTNEEGYRVSFSARGDGTSWTPASDYFDVFGASSEYVSALKVHKDVLGIFKMFSIFTYDEVELKERIVQIGAYNQKVVQEVNGDIYTFCPNGIFLTNFFSAKQIGEPVREYWENFVPQFDSTGRVVTNVWAASFMNSYLLFLGSITSPTTDSNVVLEYNTLSKNWTVHQGGFNSFVHLNGFQVMTFGDKNQTYGSYLIGGDSTGKVWKMYSNKYRASNNTVYGGDLFQDLLSDTGSPVSASFETPLYDMTYPELFKKFKNLRVLTERGVWMVEYRIENETGMVTQYKNLGSTKNRNCTLPFPSEAQGYRIGFRFSSVNTAAQSIFNGFVIEDTDVLSRP